MTLCFDTYALMEIFQGNREYLKLLDEEIVIPDLILAELFMVLYRSTGKENALRWVDRFEPYTTDIPLPVMIKAGEFRVDNARHEVSYFDSVGYIFAQEHGMKFVTGDNAFKGREGVLFIK